MKVKMSPDKFLVAFLDSLVVFTFILDIVMNGKYFIADVKENFFIFKGESIVGNLNDQMILLNNLIFICIVAIFLVAINFWIKHGKDEKVKIEKNFYPPNSLNSAKIGVEYKNKCKEKYIISLLLQLMNKGYIRLQNKNGNAKFIRLKDYDGNDLLEKQFLEGMFRKNNKILNNILPNGIIVDVLLDEITYEGLCNNFYIVIDKIKESLTTIEEVLPEFDDANISKSKLIFALTLTTCILIYLPIVNILGFSAAFFLGFIPTLILYLMFRYVLFTFKMRKNIVALCFTRLMVISTIMGKILPGLEEDILPTVLNNGMIFINFTIGIISMMTMLILLRFISKRTGERKELYSKIAGFREFLKNASNDEIKSLMNENANYYYEMIPYAYALEVEDDWFRKMNDLNLNRPSWYDGDENFSNLKKDIDACFKLISNAISIRPSDSLYV